MNIKILSRTKAEELSYTDFEGDKVIISISDPLNEIGSLNKENRSIKDMLYLSFDDICEETKDVYGGNEPMTADDAAKIARFVRKWEKKVGSIWVHCEMGVSRSAGIGIALMEYFGLDLTPVSEDENLIPNMLCYELTMEAMKGEKKMTLKDIKTERLTLRELTGDDWKNYFDHVTAANEFYVQYGYEPTEELLDLIREPTINVIYYSIIKTETNEMTGYIGILENNDIIEENEIIEDIDGVEYNDSFEDIDDMEDCGNIEFYIFKEHRNNGFCGEALGAFMKAYLNGEMTGMAHDMIAAETLAENKASQRVLEKAGFEKEALGLKLFLNEEEQSGFSGVAGLKRYVYRKAGNTEKTKM